MRLLIFYSYFTPAYKAGGPIRSIQNLVDLIKGDLTIDIVCSAFDLGEKEVLPGISPNEWNTLSESISVFYIKTGTVAKIRNVIGERKPDIIYINGIFLPTYGWLPIFLAKVKRIPIVITPRGMLQQGAMAAKSFKKRAAIRFLRASGLLNGVTWQATDEQERVDILSYFGENAIVKVIGNVPSFPLAKTFEVRKNEGELRLIFLSLITRKKNLDLVLRILKRIKRPVSLDIYGPVKDEAYWQECLRLTQDQVHSIRYLGPVNPGDVQQTVKKYHALILLTKGENFGHAIYEALSAGIPAIISQYTPWGDLQLRQAGITVDINNPNDCCAGINTFLSLNQENFERLSTGAYELAKEYFSSCNFKKLYVEMFSDAAVRKHTKMTEGLKKSSIV